MTGVSLHRLCKLCARATCVACSSTLAPPRHTHRKSGCGVLETLAGAEASVCLAHLEQHAALFLGPLLGCRWARTDFRRRQAVVRGLHTTDRTGRDHGRGVPAEWPLVSRVWLRTGRLCPSHEPGARRRCAAHARSWVSPTSACSSCPRAATTSSTPGMSGAYVAPGVMTSSWTTCSCPWKTRSRPLPRWLATHSWPSSPFFP